MLNKAQAQELHELIGDTLHTAEADPAEPSCNVIEPLTRAYELTGQIVSDFVNDEEVGAMAMSFEVPDAAEATPSDRYVTGSGDVIYDLERISSEIQKLEEQNQLPNRLWDCGHPEAQPNDYFLDYDIELLAWRWLARRKLGS